MTEQMDAGLERQRTICVGQGSVEVNIDYRDRIMWVNENRISLHIAVDLEGLTEFDYNVQERTLSMALDGALQYVEIPCTQREAEKIVSSAGWDIGRLRILRE